MRTGAWGEPSSARPRPPAQSRRPTVRDSYVTAAQEGSILQSRDFSLKHRTAFRRHSRTKEERPSICTGAHCPLPIPAPGTRVQEPGRTELPACCSGLHCLPVCKGRLCRGCTSPHAGLRSGDPTETTPSISSSGGELGSQAKDQALLGTTCRVGQQEGGPTSGHTEQRFPTRSSPAGTRHLWLSPCGEGELGCGFPYFDIKDGYFSPLCP